MLLAGAGCLAAGLLPWPAFGSLAGRTAPILAFVVAMTLVTELVDDAGLFRVLADRVSALGRGSVFLLWLFVLALSAIATAFLSLDTTAVLVTPVVVLLAVHARIPPLPFALSTVWLANTASLFLPVSNLSNLLAQSSMSLSPLEFAKLMWAPAAVGVVVPSLLLWLAFRRDLRGRYGPQPVHAARDRTLLRASAGTLVVLLPALVSGVPVAIPAALAAGFLLAIFVVRRPSALRWSMLPWRPLMLTAGLFMVVETLHAHGLTQALAPAAGAGETFPDLLRLAALGAGSANIANNLPAYLALEPAAGSPLRLGALLIGVNLGPLISPWASLATLLWHERLQSLNLRVRWGGFAVAGAAVVVLALPLAVLALWLGNGMP
ncbi:SLC13 family permease [Arthrobacter sp. NPDC057013]|uniref:SLC13 family permease n=1 Tax=Arthrobacter sp. NPDC057013 TaxID=3345999 RepID=UPI0036422FE8